MPDNHTDLVIQMSTSAAASREPGAAPESTDDSQLIKELDRSLQPGAEIVLILGTYIARTSILWRSSVGQDSSFRAGIRLVCISARTDYDYHEPSSEEEPAQSPARA
jgi:hypothetical protein